MNRLRAFAVLAGLALAAVAGGFAGATLGERASERGTHEVVIADPALAPDDSLALRSAAGFTGFEGAPALSGRVMRAGSIESVGDETLEVVSEGSLAQVSLASPSRLLTMGSLTRELAPGDIVLVHLSDDGDAAAGVLRVPAGLRGEGD